MKEEEWLQDVLPGYEDEIAKLLAKNKKRELEKFFTNPGGRVTAIVPGSRDMTAATLTARFSRAQEPDPAELFWNEFRQKLGDDVADRILNQYGDDSVREQASGYVMVKGVSVLTSMKAFRHPLVTGIEASTRYINWSEFPLRDYAIYPEKITTDPEAAEIFGRVIETTHVAYKTLWPLVWNYVSLKNPKKGDQTNASYNKAIKGEVCDTLRGLLPLGIKTSFGIHADYRTLSEVIMNLRASKFDETREVADEIAQELVKVNQVFISVSNKDHGTRWTEHQKLTDKILQDFGMSEGRWIRRDNDDLDVAVKILNKNWIGDLLREALVSENGGLSDYEDHELSREFLSHSKLENLLKKLGEARTNRRHKLPSFFDAVTVRVRVENLSFGAFKDLNRHRHLQTKSETDWSGDRGFVIPDIIQEMGGEVETLYREAQTTSLVARKDLMGKYPEESKLLLTHGAKTSFEMVMGLGELFWIAELRSIASGNPEYRKIAIKMYEKIIKEVPILSFLGSFVDNKEYSLGRIAEAVRADLRGK